MTAKCSPFSLPRSSRRREAVEGYAHGLRKVGRDTEVSGELVRGAGRDDRNGGV